MSLIGAGIYLAVLRAEGLPKIGMGDSQSPAMNLVATERWLEVLRKRAHSFYSTGKILFPYSAMSCPAARTSDGDF